MADPVVVAVASVGVALTKVLLRACDNSFGADLVGDGQDFVGILSRALHRTDESKGQIERRVSQALATRTRAMRERCSDQGVDPDLLSGACTEVEIILEEIADDGALLLSAVRSPKSFPEILREHAARRRMNIESAAEPYFDELTNAVAAQYGALAPWSPRFQIEAFKSILSGIDEIQENSQRSLDAHAITHDKLDTLSSKLSEVAHQENKPRRVFFGSRPDVVTGDRYIKRDEKKHLNALIVDPTKHRTVLVGMRGCGKTQLAAALAQECEDADWCLVAWVHAGSPESIKSGLIELAKELKINTSDQPTQEQIVGRCLDYLRSSEASDRLIIFDNVEDINDLRGLVPSGDSLRVVATTTNNTGWDLQEWDTIEVSGFDRKRSIRYLLTVINSTDHDAAATLAHRLGDLPLAIAQAAATVRNGNLSLARYLDRLDRYRSERVIRPVPGDYYTDDVATALCMATEDALDNLANNTKHAALHQLGALALLAESGVPTRWLDPTIEQLYDNESPGTQRDTDQDAHDALTELIHRSIVQQSADGSTTMLHRLQAQVLRESWTQEDREQARESAAALLGSVDVDAFPRDDTYSRRKETHDLLEQLRSFNEQPYSVGVLKIQPARWALNNTLKHAYDLGFPEEATTLSGIVRYVQNYLGSSSRDARTLANNLAVVYQASGHLDIAISIYERNYEETRRVIGSDKSETLEVRSNLLYAYQTADRLDEAIRGYKQLVIDCNRVLGCPHQLTLTVRNNEAAAHQAAGLLQEAIRLYEEVLRDHIRYLSSDNPNTLATRNNLALAYQYSGQLNKAIEQYEMVRNDGTRIMGADHPNTLTWRDNLASAYLEAGRLTESVILYEQVHADCVRIFGENHTQTLISRDKLAGAYVSAGRPDEAIALFERVLIDHTRILGKDHPKTLASRDNLAYTYLLMGRTDDAVSHFEQTLIESTQALGEYHPSTVSARKNLEVALHVLEQRKDDVPAE